MSEFQVLSSEEVDALLKVTQEANNDLSTVVSSNNEAQSEHWMQKTHVLNNITELARAECEKLLSAFLRKKIVVKSKSSNLSQVTACINPETDKRVYSAFRVMPHDRYGIVALDYPLLHQSINLLYGGKVNKEEPVIENPGKVGVIVAEKICQICLNGFIQACQEYGAITCEVMKTTPLFNLISNLSMEDQVYMMELAIFIDEIETTLKLMVAEEFFNEFIPSKSTAQNKHREKDFWRTAIKSQVVDSLVNVSVTLPDINMKVSDFVALKEGDVIPISDPTMVYVCLNSIKLFRASAGQSNSKRVVKILNQI